MKAGRKDLKRAAKDQNFNIEHGQSIMQVLSLRGSNLIEVMDARGEKSLALFPAKFQRSIWIKQVDESGTEKALESGSKVACIVSQVLFYEQVRARQKSPEWSEIFKSSNLDDSIENEGDAASDCLQRYTSQQEVKDDVKSSDDDGLPPLEVNLNRIKPFEMQSDGESVSESDTN